MEDEAEAEEKLLPNRPKVKYYAYPVKNTAMALSTYFRQMSIYTALKPDKRSCSPYMCDVNQLIIVPATNIKARPSTRL